ncbi:hypothetical protein FisN_36Hh025 [Fistulifera solaris]|uniref:Uncharacterized protein n=1 Tax=Fistulifera solaris TaxID=1519565 RepID=A0A1Z5KU13_FISSO|nr:hypothetical protein FisN_36Hh025 [Fistulifera solaris]|eukprot:GAX29531.1 hypothetical protein FisN_36Hh025 [Fistulifera solaris]
MQFRSVTLLLLPACTAGFFFNNNLIRPPAPTKPKVSSDEERAAAMSQYLAKAHEEKLRAVKAAEDKKMEEIRLLKEEIAALKAAKSPVVVSSPPPGPIGELAKYQEFMKTYIVNAHKQKVDAIKAAEAALNKRWEAKLAELGFGAPSPAVAPPSDILKPKVVNELLAARNEGVKASASAGKSRWGESEVHKVKTGTELGSFVKSDAPATLSAPPRVPVVASSPGDKITETPEIIAADHGLRADGGVGGPSLAERVALGPNIGAKIVAGVTSVSSKAPASSLTLEERLAGGVNIGARIVKQGSTVEPVPVATDDSTFFSMRNAKVLHEAEAGKSRWGTQEIERVRTLPRSSTAGTEKAVVPVPPEVEAADHGLRADGGVGGPTLAERIALGANIGAEIVAQSAPSSTSLYEKRNVQVTAAAAAGKSRWGSQEIGKLSSKTIDSVEIVNSHEDIFEQRNNKVLAESAAGKSRWGKEEITRLQMHSGSAKGFPAKVNGSVVGV